MSHILCPFKVDLLPWKSKNPIKFYKTANYIVSQKNIFLNIFHIAGPTVDSIVDDAGAGAPLKPAQGGR